MSCHCDGLMEPFRELERRARVGHQCTECRNPIRPGEKYTAVSGCYEGSWSHRKICSPCDELLRALQSDCDCICYDVLEDFLGDELSQYGPGEGRLADVSPEAFGHAFGLYYGSSLRCDDYKEQRMAQWRQRQA